MNLIPDLTDRITELVDNIETALAEWDAVKGGDFTQAMVDRGNTIIADLLNGAK